MLRASNITKAYGDNIILENVSFIVNPGDRLGLIGPNGCGKTTLLRILAGQERPDAGSVQFSPPDLRLGYLEQGLAPAETDTVAEFLRAAPSRLEEAEREVARLAEALTEAGDAERPRLMRAYDAALAELERLAASQTAAHDAEAVLAGLGLGEVPLHTLVATLSGGQKTRLGLARLLLNAPHILLLDEPTNHLDIEALEWLEGWLRRFRGAAVIVSHDRTFLDCTVTSILELDPDTHAVAEYPGTYSDYVDVKTRQREKQWTAYKEQQERIARIEEGIRELSAYADRIERGSIHFHIRKIAKGIARRAVVQRERLERELERERVEKPRLSWQMKLEFADAPVTGQDVLILENVAAGYDGAALFSGVSEILRAGERVALVGPNGAGKTTLLRVITGALPPMAGRVRLGSNVRLGYYAQEQENLSPDATPLDIIRGAAALSQTDARSFLHYFLFAGDDVFVRVGDLSYGERARLALAQMAASGCNLLLLDEPINHLDIPSRARFEQALAAFEGTVLAVVHDRYFIRGFATRLWALSAGALTSHLSLDDVYRCTIC